MPILRQMPQLYLRGSLAAITMAKEMANLDQAEKDRINDLVIELSEHPGLQKHKQQLFLAMSKTIKSDYRDRGATENEYRIAIWRAVVNLYYHKHYTYKCRNCHSGTYLTKRNKPTPINRLLISCPNCEHTQIDNPGNTSHTTGQFVPWDELSQINDPGLTCITPISYIPGEFRYENPDDIVNDPKQLTKFFGEFIWNYFRQQIKENVRVEHRCIPNRYEGPGDEVLLWELISLLHARKAAYKYWRHMNPESGWYRVYVLTNHFGPEFALDFSEWLKKGRDAGIQIEWTEREIRIRETPQAPTMSAMVLLPEYVVVQDQAVQANSDGTSETVDSLDGLNYRTIGGMKMYLDNPIDCVSVGDALYRVRESLPDGQCRQLYDILSQQGDAYTAFISEFPDGQTKMAQLAQHLNVTPRIVTNFKQTIRHACLANGLVPAGVRV